MSNFNVLLLFSPQNCEPEILERNLTENRRALADKLIASIRGTASDGASRYDLVVGPRGTGKTHLLTYIELKIKEDQECPLRTVRLSEEELGIVTHIDFLVACLRAVGISIEDMYDDLRSAEGHEVAEARLLEKLGDEPVLLIVENLATMLNELKEPEQRQLRSFLQRNTHISVLAASPALFEDSAKADHPFYGSFLIHPLDQLTRLDAHRFLIQLAEAKVDAKLVESLRSEKGLARINAVYDLTGGNHRLLGMLSECLSADDLKTLVEPLVRMVDRELTPYYQQRLFALPAQQAKILRAIARNEVPLTVKEISRLSLATEQTTSSQLRALKETGLVRDNQRGRESYYELQEPLMRMVLDIKEGREEVLPSIVALLRDWYEAEELQELAQQYDGFSRDYYEAALSQKRMTTTMPREAHVSDTATEESGDFLAEADQLMDSGMYEAAIAAIDNVVSHLPKTDDPETRAKFAEALVLKGVAFGNTGSFEDALVIFDGVALRFAQNEEPEIQEQVARALNGKGFALGNLGRYEDAIEAYDDVVARFAESDSPGIQVQVVQALCNKGFVLGNLGRYEDAIEAYDDVVARFVEDETLEIQEQVARALFCKGVTLGKLGRHDDAVEACEGVASHFSVNEATKIQVQVARALFNKGFALWNLGRHVDAVEAYDDVVAHFGVNGAPEIQEVIAWTLFGKGSVLASLGRLEEEKSCHEELLMRFDTTENKEVLNLVARTLARRMVIGSGTGPELNRIASILETDRGLAVDIFELLIVDLSDRPDDLRRLAGFEKLQEELVIGLTQWIQSQLPLSEEEAEGLAEAERNLSEAFGLVEGAKKVLDLFSAARAHSLGDKKALLRLPLESRRLVERAYGIGEDD